MAIEMLTGEPLVPGDSEVSQIKLLFDLLGGNDADESSSHSNFQRKKKILDAILRQKPGLLDDMEHRSKIISALVDLCSQLLAWNPDNRISASDALKHAFFTISAEQEW